MEPKKYRRREKDESENFYAPKIQLAINFANDVADHAAELLWGQGFLATHKNEKANKRIQDLLRYNNADEYFAHREKLLSLYGNIYETVDMVDGKPTWTIADPLLNSMPNTTQIPTFDTAMYGIGRAFVSDIVAVIWKKITYGTVAFPIKEIHWPNKVERIFFGANNKQVSVSHVNAQLPANLQVSELWEHNIGLIEGKLPTIKWARNLPVFNGMAPADGYKGSATQTLANKTLIELFHETETNRTRLIGNLDETTYNQLMKNGDLAEINKNDFLINVRFKNATGANDNVLQPIIANPQFESYWASYHAAKDEYFMLAGYSPLGDGNAEKTATESLLMKTADYQTTKKKRNLRMKETFDLLYATMVIDAKLGFGTAIYGDFKNIREDFTFEIMENKVMDSLQEATNLNTMYEMGVISRVEMVAKLRGITKEEAKQVIQEIDAEFEADTRFQDEGLEGGNNETKPKTNK